MGGGGDASGPVEFKAVSHPSGASAAHRVRPVAVTRNYDDEGEPSPRYAPARPPPGVICETINIRELKRQSEAKFQPTVRQGEFLCRCDRAVSRRSFAVRRSANEMM